MEGSDTGGAAAAAVALKGTVGVGGGAWRLAELESFG